MIGSGVAQRGPLAATKLNFSVSSVPLKPKHRGHGGSPLPLCLFFS